MLFKILLFAFVIIYVLFKISQLILKMIFMRAAGIHKKQTYAYQSHHKKAQGSNLNIDYIPGKNKSDESGKNFKGGDYVDFEEIK